MDVETAIRLVERKLEILETISNTPSTHVIWEVISSLIYLASDRDQRDRWWVEAKTPAEREERKRRALGELERWPFDCCDWECIEGFVSM
ncbi:MAG: hypothetical protein QXS54_01360, partial [Candidatus Methanomethylicaceae archaeon]